MWHYPNGLARLRDVDIVQVGAVAFQLARARFAQEWSFGLVSAFAATLAPSFLTSSLAVESKAMRLFLFSHRADNQVGRIDTDKRH